MNQQFENGIFSDFQIQQLSQAYLYAPLPQLNTPKLSQNIVLGQLHLQSRKPSLQLNQLNQIPIVNQYSTHCIKAFNPMQMVEKMPPEKQKQYMRIANGSKNFNGLQFFFEAEDYNYNSSNQSEVNFLSGINQRVFNYDHEPKSGDLSKLFQTQGKHESQIQHIQRSIQKLRGKMSESQQKCFNSIMLNKTIGPAFYEHFQNFSLVSNPVNFLQQLETNLIHFINHAKRFKEPGVDLIYSIYDFWIKSFKDFVNQVWKYSSKYTLNFFKKQRNSQMSEHSESTKKQSIKDNKQKRKNWDPDEIRILQRIIQSNVIFSQNKLKQLSEELGRSVNSISSKIQKIIKSKKGEQYQEDSLLKKTIEVLKLSPEGLNKDSIIQRINEYYQMGYDGQWEKSVGQLLSSRKEFNKIKGKYRLIDGQKYKKVDQMEDENYDKLTFRDKVIKCFLKFENYESDLKSLIEMYILLYEQKEALGGGNNQERKKSIESSISKTLSRYDIFDTSNSKTLYQYQMNAFQNNQKAKCQQSFEQMIDL